MSLLLTAQHVRDLAQVCRPEEAGEHLDIEAVRHTFRFSRARLEAQRASIDELLAQLPTDFRSLEYGGLAGGGWTFLNACMRADGVHWGEHADVELLLALGLAIGSVRWSLGRDLWEALPGGMPYFDILPPQVPA